MVNSTEVVWYGDNFMGFSKTNGEIMVVVQLVIPFGVICQIIGVLVLTSK